MDKYDSQNDHYCYQGTNILVNKLNIRDIDELEKVEREITSITIRDVKFSPPPYNLKYMQKLHRQLFSALYVWAGELRDVDIAKNETLFCNNQRIVAEAKKLFKSLEQEKWLNNLDKDQFCNKLAEYYCEINMLHPFREGNGRVQRILFEHLSLAAGYDLDWGKISQEEWIKANIDGVNVNYEPMSRIFKRIVTSVHFAQ